MLLLGGSLWSGFSDPQSRAPSAGVQQPAADEQVELIRYLERRPRDARAWAIYARLNFAQDNYAAARDAYARAVALPGRVSRDPMLWCEYADAVALINGGSLAGRPGELIAHALTLDPRHPRALEMAGSAAIERGDYAEALAYWEQLLPLLPPDTSAFRELGTAIERTRLRTGG